MINTQYFKLDIKKPTIPRLRVVNGDTANVFVITIQDDGNAVTLDTTLHKIIAVFTRADGQVYTQDADTGVSFATGGVVTIAVRPASFRTGTNKVCLQIYKRENSSATVYPLLCTTNEAQFPARSQAIPDSGAPNAPSQLPMLEGLIDDARDAISDCETATQNANDAADAANDAADAANTAAETLNGLLENIDDEPTQNSDHLVKSGGVYSFVNDKVQEAADDLRAQIPEGASSATAEKPKMDGTAYAGVSTKWAHADHVHPSDTSKQNVLTFDDAPTAGSNNPVKSGGIKTAIDAAANKNVYLVKHDSSTWENGAYQTYTDDTADKLATIADSAAFASCVTLPTGETVTCYETHRSGSDVFLKSETVSGKYVTADFMLGGMLQSSHLEFDLHDDESPLLLHITGTEEVQGTGGQTYRKVTFASGETDKIYAYRNTLDMLVRLPVWDAVNDVVEMLRLHEVVESGTITVVRFETGLHPLRPLDSVQDLTVGNIDAYEVAVYYNNGAFSSAVATHFTGTL